MKKTLIALALTALPVAAMADVTLYGQIKGGVGVEQTTIKGVQGEDKYSLNGSSTDTVVRDFGSRVGFKGEEDLGNGLKTIWQVEQSVSLGGNTSTGWSNRQTFIGLEGAFGKVRVGHLDNVFNEQDDYDAWEYDEANPLGLGIFSRHNGRVDGASIKYDTPDFAGFSGSLHYRTKSNEAGRSLEQKDADNKARSEGFLGLAYENSGFFAKYGFGYAENAYQNQSGKNKNGQLHRIQGGYDANNLFVDVAFQYGKGWETSDDYLSQNALNVNYAGNNNDSTGLIGLINDNGAKVADTGIKTKELALTAAYTMGAVTPRISYAHGFKIKNTNGDNLDNSKYDQVVIGADYALSKRTTALVSAGWLRQGLGVNADDAKIKMTKKAAGVGLKHVF